MSHFGRNWPRLPALTLVTTQDTARILRRTSGTRVSGTIVVSISWDGHNTVFFRTKSTSFLVVFLRSLFAGGDFWFSGVLFWQVLHLEHVWVPRQIWTNFWQNFWTCRVATSVNIAVPELAVTSLPGLLACRPWQAASGLVQKLRHHDCWEPSSTYQGTRTSPCFSATILVNFRGFSQRKSYCLVFFTKMRTRF